MYFARETNSHFAKASRIRTRLTVFYIAIFGLVLLAFVCVACTLHYLQLVDQLYHAEVQDMETVEGLLFMAPDGRMSLHQEYFMNPQHRLMLDRLLEVLDLNGKVLFRNEKLAGRSLGGPPTELEKKTDYFRQSLLLPDGTRVLTLSHVRPFNGKTVLIRLGYSTATVQRESIELIVLLTLIVPFALLVGGSAGYNVAGAALDPLERMAKLTERITASNLHERIPVKNADDELGHMARVLNGLLERLEISFQQLARFAESVSHELRTPLAAMRSTGENALHEEHDPGTVRAAMESMLEEVSRLTSIIDTLLTIAHAHSGVIKLNRSVFSFMTMVQESIEIVRILAEAKKQTLLVEGADEVNVHADRPFLCMAVVNVLDNAIKYSPPGSAINVRVQPDNSPAIERRSVELYIEDQGPGIPESARERIFDRFYRLEDTRGHDSGGVGLGLPIARWAVEAHEGQLSVKPAPSGGSIFCIRVPASTPTTSNVQ